MNWYKLSTPLGPAPHFHAPETTIQHFKSQPSLYSPRYTDEEPDIDQNRVSEKKQQISRIFSNFYRRAIRQGYIKLYRSVRAPSFYDVNMLDIGMHWSWKPKAAISYDYGAGSRKHDKAVDKNFMFEGEVHYQDVDWNYSYWHFDTWPEQYEITLKPEARIFILSINGQPVNDMMTARAGDPEKAWHRPMEVHDEESTKYWNDQFAQIQSANPQIFERLRQPDGEQWLAGEGRQQTSFINGRMKKKLNEWMKANKERQPNAQTETDG